MNIIILGVRIIEDSDNRGSDNRGCTVLKYFAAIMPIIQHGSFYCGVDPLPDAGVW